VRSFYETFGFEPVDDVPGHYDDGGDAVVLARSPEVVYRPDADVRRLFDELALARADDLTDAALGGHVEQALAHWPVVEDDRLGTASSFLDEVEGVLDRPFLQRSRRPVEQLNSTGVTGDDRLDVARNGIGRFARCGVRRCRGRRLGGGRFSHCHVHR